jgi:ABC-type Zn2+ transport system substrate-binding protein/surface adhesin
MLARNDPDAASIYLERAGNFMKRLEEFDHQARVELTPHTEAAFALHHPAFVPYVERYGLNLVAVLQVHPEGEAEPRTLGEVTRKMRAAGARVVFSEPQLGTRLAESVAVDLDARLAMLDGLGGEGMEGRETYIGLLRWNLGQLMENLDGRGD